MNARKQRPLGLKTVFGVFTLSVGVLIGLLISASLVWASSANGAGAARPASTDTASTKANHGVDGNLGPFRLAQHMLAPAQGIDQSVTTDGRFVYVAGGVDLAVGNFLDQFVRYDPLNDSWSALAPMPTPVVLSALVYSPATNKFYSFGGGDVTDCSARNVTFIYDVASGTWTSGADMPEGRLAFAGVGYHNGRIYLAGGDLSCDSSTSIPQSQIWIYDIASNSWTTGAAMPQALADGASGMVNGHLYVLGGVNSHQVVVSTIYDYDIASNRWVTSTASLLNPTSQAGSAVANGRVWAIGGEDFNNPASPGALRASGQPGTEQTGAKHPYTRRARSAPNSPEAPIGTTQVFDPATGTVTWGPYMNIAREDLGATSVGNYVVAVGGFNGGAPNGDFSLDITEVSVQSGSGGSVTPTSTATQPVPSGTPTCTTGAPHNPWAVANPMPRAAFLPGVASDGTYVYSAGGSSDTEMLSQFIRYNPSTDSWSSLAPMPSPANGLALVYSPINNKLYAFGGTAVVTQSLDITRIYDISTGTWSTGAPLPNPRSRFAGTGYHNGKIYLAGGTADQSPGTSQNDTWEYDVLSDSWTIKLPVPIPLSAAASAVVDAHLYIIGGRTRTAPTLSTVYDYDIEHDFWTLLNTTLPTNVYFPGGTEVHGRIWVVGGVRGSPTYVTQIFDPHTRSFSQGPSLNVARYGLGAASAGNYVVAVGGYDFGGSNLATTEVTTQLPECVPTPSPSPTACMVSFSDVPEGSTFYPYIRCLACRGIITGYADGTFRPSSNVTRGQAAKIIANSVPYNDAIPPDRQTFSDVPSSNSFWLYIERAALHGVVGGYADGTFRPGNNLTRGQIAKIDAIAAGYSDSIPPARQTFSDVPPGSPFWVYIERVALHGVVSGYDDGTYRPGNNVTRGQASKIVANTFFPNCAPPTR